MLAGSAQAGLVLDEPMNGSTTGTASPAGTPTFYTSSMGQALYCDGTGDNPGLVFSLPVAGEFTVAFWMGDAPGGADYPAVAGLYNDGSPGQEWDITFDDNASDRMWNQMTFDNWGDWTDSAWAAPDLLTGAWNHIVCTYDGATLKTYINGAQDPATGDATGVAGYGPWSTDTFRFGVPNPTYGAVTGGYNNVKVYDNALTGPEVKALYDSYVPVLDEPMDGSTTGTASPAGTPTFYESSRGQTLYADGTGDNPGVEFNVAVAGGFTVSFWLEASGGLDYPTAAGLYNAVDNGQVWDISFDDNATDHMWNQLSFESPGWASYIWPETSMDLLTGAFNHIVCTYDGADLYTYINGALENGPVDATGLGAYGPWSTDSFRLAAFDAGYGVVAGGYDDVKVYSTALTGPQVLALYTSEIVPVIDTQPASQLIPDGDPVVFTIAATNPITGGSTGLDYEWSKDGTPIVPAETADTLTIAAVGAADAGDYTCLVTIAATGKSLNSDAATLTVDLGATIIDAPMDGDAVDDALPENAVSAYAGGSFTFGTSSRGQALYVDGTPTAEGADYDLTLDTGAVSISFWLEHAAVPVGGTWPNIVGLWNANYPTAPYLYLYGEGGSNALSIQMNAGAGDAFITRGGHMATTGLKHYVITYDGATCSLYANGGLEDSVATAGSLDGTGLIQFGMEGVNLPAYYDDVRVCNYILSAEQIKYLYDGLNDCPVPPAADLTGDCIVNLEDVAIMASEWLEDLGVPVEIP